MITSLEEFARYNFLLPIYQDYEEAMRIKKLIVTGVITPIFDGVKYSSVAEATAAASARYYTLIDSVERAIIEVAFIVVTNTTEKDKMWNDGARTMLRAIIWTMLRCSEKPEYVMTAYKFTVANICRIASSTENDCALIIKWLKLAEDITCVKSAITSNYGLNAKVTRDGYIATLNTAISEYNSKAIEAMTATSSEIDLRKVARSKEPYAIFVVTDERQKTTNNICTMLINNLVNELVEAADRNPNHSLPRDFVFLIDEFANIPALPNLSNKITTFRSRRIWLTMAIQSVQQLKMVYGEETSEILKDNCDLQIFLGCNNDETKEAFVRSMGMKIGVKTSYAIASDGSMSASRGTENVPVITKSDLDSLNLGEFYVRSRQCRNIKSYMEPYFMQEDCYKWRLTGAEKFRFVNSAKNEYSIKFVDEKQSLAPNSTAKPF